MASKLVRSTLREVKPVMSSNQSEARARVLKLYKAWYRQIPFMIAEYDLTINIEQARAKLRELFLKNKDTKDIRAIDILVVKGQQDLVETANNWKQRVHIMKFFKDSENPRPTDFLSKFYAGHE